MTISTNLINKLKNEEQRQNQIYNNINTLISNNSILFFFNNETIHILREALYITKKAGLKTLINESIFLAFFAKKKNIIFFNYISSFFNIIKIYKIFYNFIKSHEKVYYIPFQSIKNLKISESTHYVLLKALFNTIQRFKLSVITPDILFLTLMEEIPSHYFSFNQREEYHQLHFYLTKKILNSGQFVKKVIPVEQRYFSHLLQVYYPCKIYHKILYTKFFKRQVFSFRKSLIFSNLHKNVFKLANIKKRLIKSRNYNYIFDSKDSIKNENQNNINLLYTETNQIKDFLDLEEISLYKIMKKVMYEPLEVNEDKKKDFLKLRLAIKLTLPKVKIITKLFLFFVISSINSISKILDKNI